MNISEWAIKRPIPVVILFIILTIAGIYSFYQIRVQKFPDLDLPTVTVTVSLSGATPAQLETQITRKVEDSVASISMIKHISSSISDGSSVTTIEFDLSKNLLEAEEDVKENVGKISSQFPAGTTDPVVARITNSDSALLTYQISADLDKYDLSWIVDNDISKMLVSVPGVGEILRNGGVDREIEVLVDPLKLITLNTTINDISNQLYNVQQNFSGGRMKFGGSEQVIQEQQSINNVNDIAKLNIPLSTSSYIHLSDVAQVVDTNAEVRQMAFLNGESVISFSVYTTRSASELAVAGLVRAKIADYIKANPNIHITEISNTIEPISSNYSSSMKALYEGCILAVVIVWLFLRDWRATFVAATALPLSIIPTFLFIYLMGFSLNTISLLALTLVIGVLVDDAIVEVENIVRHLQHHESPIKAAIEAAQEIGTAVIATSFSLVAVFLPTAFMGEVPGKIFKQFGWTATIAILLSLLVARLLTPMMAAYFMKSHPEKVKPQGKIMTKYLQLVTWCLENKIKTMSVVGAAFLASMTLLMFIPTTFFPAADNSQVSISFETAPGSKIDQAINVIRSAYAKTKSMPEITDMYATIGTGVQSSDSISTDGDVTSGKLTFDLVDSNKRKQSQSQLEKSIQNILNTIPGAKFSGASGNGERYSLVLASDDTALLQDTAKVVESEIRAIQNIGNVNSEYNLVRPEIHINPNFNHAAELGVTPNDMGQVIRVATSGDYSTKLASLYLPDRDIPIRVKLTPSALHSPEVLAQLRLKGNNGTVPLSSVADIQLNSGPVSLTRYDRYRSTAFNIDLNGRNISDIDNMINNLPSLQHLPKTVHRVASGDIEHMQEMFGDFKQAMIIGILGVYLVLALLFNNFKHPFTILAALPLAISGALASLILFGYSISMSTVIGILMLMGIVTKNSILLVDYILNSIKDGNSVRGAIIDACHKRVRPIIMTTIAMIAGMLPIALGLDGDSSFRAPMAVTVIAGLITSTILSLFVIPIMFELIDRIKFNKKN